MKRFVATYPVRFGEIDHAGIMYYPSLFDRMHRAFEDFWPETVGKTYPQVLDGDGVGFPLIDVHANFVQPFRFGDTMRVEIDVLRIGTRSLTFRLQLSAGDGSGPRATAEMVTGVIDMATFESQPLPESYRKGLEPYLVPPEGSSDP